LIALGLAACLPVVQVGNPPRASAQDVKPLRVVSEQTVKGFAFPESVAYDPQAKVLYVSEFGSELKPAEKDGKGRISRVSLTGEVLDKQFLPAAGDVLNKPKGSWVVGNRLWVTRTSTWSGSSTSRPVAARSSPCPESSSPMTWRSWGTRSTSATTGRISSTGLSRPTSWR